MKRIRKRKFATRMAFFIMMNVGVCFLIGFYMIIKWSTDHTRKTAIENSFNKLELIEQNIEMQLSKVSSVVDNFGKAMETILKEKGADYADFQSVTRTIVEQNPNVVGSIVALKPYYFPKEEYCAIYSSKQNGNVVTEKLGGIDYDYFTADWYLVPTLSGSSYWTDPYVEGEASSTEMTTYSYPLRDSSGSIIGVFTADISLDAINNYVNSFQLYENSYNMLIAKNGLYLSHGDPSKIMCETPMTDAIAYRSETLKKMAVDASKGNRGYGVLGDAHKDYDNALLAFYIPVPAAHWTVAAICPVPSVFIDTYEMGNKFVRVSTIIFFILFGLTVLIITRLSSPLKAFAKSARDIADGNWTADLPNITVKDELYQMRESFRYMQKSLISQMSELKSTTAAKERVEGELNIARNIQMSMIPKIFPPYPDRTDIDIYAFMRPAKEVGGDLYDFFLADNKFYFTLGDVSGKGVPAALFMAVSRSIFRTIAQPAGQPELIVRGMNAAISGDNESNMFVTLFVGILDLETGLLSYCNAGHNPPVVMRADGSSTDFLQTEGRKNLPIGLFEDAPYDKHELQLNSHDTLFLYTDGLTEAENSKAELYSDPRLVNMLRNVGSHIPMRDLLDNVLADVEAHAAGAAQSDDLTMMAMSFVFGQNTAAAATDGTENAVEDEKEISDVHSANYRSVELVNNIDQINNMTSWVEGLGDEFGMNMAQSMSINLALEEAVANVIMYAYPKDGNEYKFLLDFDMDENRNSTWRIIDSGRPFNPTTKADADTTLSAEERGIGGLGILMVKKIMDSVEYERIHKQNILTMKVVLKD